MSLPNGSKIKLYFLHKIKHYITHYWKHSLGILLLLFITFLLLDWCFPTPSHIDYATVITDKQGKTAHAFLSKDDKWRMKALPEEISPLLEKAILYKEDKYFYYHPGVNPIAIGRAAFNNIVKGKRTSGASTITMQLARLLEPRQRTYSSKLIEVFRAMQLEWHFSKTEILQMYLNHVPYGGNIEGIKAAALLYFNKAPNHLSLAEVTALSIIPNRPNSLRIGKHNEYIVTQRNKWLQHFQEGNLFDDLLIADALEEPLTAYRLDAPKKIPHLAYRLKRQYPNKAIINSTIDLKQQEKVERLVKQHVNQLRAWRIQNAAVLVIDNRTMEVVSYVGSADFNNAADAGQVDGIRAVRSPGSTLKPLLYGIAFDKGLITPKHIVSDVPTNFSGYVPENYDGKFRGKVSIEFALANSLNIPAVKVMNQIGPATFIDYLKRAKFRQIQSDQNKLGLAMALGGCGVRLEELTQLYSSFAKEGQLHPIRYTHSPNPSIPQSLHPSKQILSPSANFMTTEILLQLTRPDLPVEWHNSAHLPKVAWKTGTSYGRRDAWSIGYNKHYTIGVWVGNFSAKGVPELSGASSAAPLLFNIFNEVDYNAPKDWYDPPKELDYRLVCSQSGLSVNHFCEDQVIDAYIPTTSRNELCQHLKEVYITPDSTMAYCTSCLPLNGYKKAHFPNYSPEIRAYYDNYQVHYQAIPIHNPKCERLFAEGAPKIISPVNSLEYYVEKKDTQQLMLSCQVSSDVDKVFWYVNKRFHQASLASEPVFIDPPAGRVDISCTDDKGRQTQVWVLVNKVDL